MRHRRPEFGAAAHGHWLTDLRVPLAERGVDRAPIHPCVPEGLAQLLDEAPWHAGLVGMLVLAERRICRQLQRDLEDAVLAGPGGRRGSTPRPLGHVADAVATCAAIDLL